MWWSETLPWHALAIQRFQNMTDNCRTNPDPHAHGSCGPDNLSQIRGHGQPISAFPLEIHGNPLQCLGMCLHMSLQQSPEIDCTCQAFDPKGLIDSILFGFCWVWNHAVRLLYIICIYAYIQIRMYVYHYVLSCGSRHKCGKKKTIKRWQSHLNQTAINITFIS